MALEPIKYKDKANICFDCENACGGCPWSAVDPKTDKIKFEPVEGWTARKVSLLFSGQKTKRLETTYHITACPLFKKTENRRNNNLEVSDEQFLAMMRRWKRLGEI